MSRPPNKISFLTLTEEAEPYSLLRFLTFSLLWLNIYIAIALVCCYFFFSFSSFLFLSSGLILLMFTLYVLMERRFGPAGYMLFHLIFTWLVLMYTYFVVSPYLDFFRFGREVVRNIQVNEAKKFPDASAFYFKSGKLLTDLRGENFTIDGDSENSRGSTTTYAIPLVPADWKDGDSVFVWVIAEEKSQYEEWMPFKYADVKNELEQPYLAGMVYKTPGNEPEGLKAIEDAVKENGIKTTNHPISISWMKAPEKHAAEFLKNHLIALFFINLFWIFLVLFIRTWKYFKEIYRQSHPQKHAPASDEVD